MDDGKLLLTVAEAAGRLGVARSHLYRWVMTGELSSVKLGRSRRIPVVALERFIEARLEEEGHADSVAAGAGGVAAGVGGQE